MLQVARLSRTVLSDSADLVESFVRGQMNADGGFTYDPNVPGSLVQKLAAGQIANDTFTYTVTDSDPNGPQSTPRR